MKRNKYKDYLWYTAIAVFVICVLEGIFYYHSVESPFLKVMLNIQNAIKAYKIDPDIDQEMHNKSRSYWNEVVTREAKNHGCVPFYWETGGDMNRGTGTAKEAYAIEGIMKGAAAGQYPY